MSSQRWFWVKQRYRSSATGEYAITSFGTFCWDEEEVKHLLQREDLIEIYEGSRDDIYLLADLRDMKRFKAMKKVLKKMKRLKPKEE
jgi:hypothetical protein